MSLVGLSKRYPGTEQNAVDELSLEIGKGEFVTLLGPSGCGKTSTLRIVAGLESADAGAIRFGDKLVVDVASGFSLRTDKRNLGMVFQSYAIWPNMTVAQNVAFPLRARKYPRAGIRDRVREALELVGMGGYESRPAPLLSGGQQQRVALARAIVTDPDLLLLDEPFSNLDAKLREQLRLEMKQLQERLNIAVLFVTHDQVEALALSDRIAVMNKGVIQQQGTPRELYEQPTSEFVRDFIGKTLLFHGTVHRSPTEDLLSVLLTGSSDCVVAGRMRVGEAMPAAGPVCVGVRPEDVRIVPTGAGDRPPAALRGTVRATSFIGERVEYQIEVPDQSVVGLHGHRRDLLATGAEVWLAIRPSGHTVWATQ